MGCSPYHVHEGENRIPGEKYPQDAPKRTKPTKPRYGRRGSAITPAVVIDSREPDPSPWEHYFDLPSGDKEWEGMTSDSSENLMDTAQVANMLGVRPSTIRKWVHTGFIPHVKLGRAVRYVKVDVQAWVGRQKRMGRDSLVPDVRLE